jgi:hypothetical protein
MFDAFSGPTWRVFRFGDGDVVPDGVVNVLDLVSVVQGYGICE